MIPFNVLSGMVNRLENLIPDPNLTLTGSWGSGYSTNNILNNRIVNTGNGITSRAPYVVIYPNVLDNGTKYFLYARVMVDTSDCINLCIHAPGSFEGNNGVSTSVQTPAKDTWYELYGFQTPVSDNRLVVQHVYNTLADANGKVMTIEGSPDRAGGVWAIKITGTKYENYTALQMLALVKKRMRCERFGNLFKSGRLNANDDLLLSGVSISKSADIATISATYATRYPMIRSRTSDDYSNYIGHYMYSALRIRPLVDGINWVQIKYVGSIEPGYSSAMTISNLEVGKWSEMTWKTPVNTNGTGVLEIELLCDNEPLHIGELFEIDCTYGVNVVDITKRYGASNEPLNAYCDIAIRPYINYDPHTVLLLHGDENYPEGNPRAIGDSSEYAHAVTSYGVETSDVQAKFGRSLKFDGVDDYISIPDSELFDFADGDFTIDFNGYFLNLNGDIMGKRFSTTTEDSFYINIVNGKIGMRYTVNGSGIISLTFNIILSVNTFYHIAIVRSNGYIYLYINGIKDGAYMDVGTDVIYKSEEPLVIGTSFVNGEPYSCITAYIDELRITKGKALWTENFTPPSLPHPNMR